MNQSIRKRELGEKGTNDRYFYFFLVQMTREEEVTKKHEKSILRDRRRLKKVESLQERIVVNSISFLN